MLDYPPSPRPFDLVLWVVELARLVIAAASHRARMTLRRRRFSYAPPVTRR